MVYRMYAEVAFTRALREDEQNYLDFGGYSMKAGGNSKTFDFEDYDWSFDNSGKICILGCKNPDRSYEDSDNITEDFLRRITTISDFYVDFKGIDYIEGDNLGVKSINNLCFEIIPEDGSEIKTIQLPDQVIKAYNESLKAARKAARAKEAEIEMEMDL